jgi:c-di-GMP-binding flagellar brake protein YcgR
MEKIERRNVIRIKQNVSVAYTYDDKVWLDSSLKDISEHGICIITENGASKDEPIIVQIKLPQRENRWVEIAGKVLDSKKVSVLVYQTRIQFLNLGDEQKKMLRIFVACSLI